MPDTIAVQQAKKQTQQQTPHTSYENMQATQLSYLVTAYIQHKLQEI